MYKEMAFSRNIARMNMSVNYSEKQEIEQRLRFLYVLLGRLCGKEQYKWEDFTDQDRKKQFGVFVKEYGQLKNIDDYGGNDIETRFSLKSVLLGDLTTDDRSHNINKSLISQGDEPIALNGETILHRAISFLGAGYDDELMKIIDMILRDIPGLLEHDRSGCPEYEGQTPLHLAVLKDHENLVKTITKKMIDQKYSLDPVARGSMFQGTAMMAGTPLCVAALKFNIPIFQTLKEGANIAGTNKDSDNVCHSLIHYARNCPERLDSICKMMDFILNLDPKGLSSINSPQKLLMMENREGLNPLQLATKHSFPEIFKQLYGFEVYCERISDLLQDDQVYDVTEIDTLQIKEKRVARQKTHVAGNTIEEFEEETEDHASVLPTILLQRPQTAIVFLEFPPVQQVIEQKWDRYKWYILVFGILHLAFMCLLTSSAVMRTQLTNDPARNPDESVFDPPNFEYVVGENGYVTGVCIVGLVYGLVHLMVEMKRTIANYNRKVVKKITIVTFIKYPHSNIIYRLLFILLSVCMVLDFILALIHIPQYENYCLIVAVIIGWYVLLFFIQMIKPFSFFTSLIQTVMIDLIRFAVVMLTFLIGFSTAMYMVMQGADIADDTFSGYGSTMMKMFTIMIGLGELDSLFQARHPSLAIIVFIMFVLLTAVLLLNALLAIMANTCSILLARYGDLTAHTLHYRLQKLSAILLIEDILPMHLQKGVGKIQPRRRFMNKNKKWCTDTKRRMLQYTSLAASSGLTRYLKKSKTKKRVYPNTTSFQINGNAVTGWTVTAETKREQPDQVCATGKPTDQNADKTEPATKADIAQQFEGQHPEKVEPEMPARRSSR